MTPRVERAPLEAIVPMREAYRAELACQIVHDAHHARGFTEGWLLRLGDAVAGYAATAGDPHPPRDIVREFYVRPAHRAAAAALFDALVAASGARWVLAQTNDPCLMPHAAARGREPVTEALLFADGGPTALAPRGATARPLTEAERAAAFAHEREPVGEWGVEYAGRIVATGGLTHHYNPPFSDLYMETDAAWRRHGFGSFLVQELKRAARAAGRVPSARCRPDNLASRRALERAGMTVCGALVRGRLGA